MSPLPSQSLAPTSPHPLEKHKVAIQSKAPPNPTNQPAIPELPEGFLARVSWIARPPAAPTITGEMGISSMPAPKDSLLTYLLYNTAVSIAILADLVRSALVFLGLPVPPAGEDGDDQLAAIAGGPSLADRFRSSFKPARFGRRRGAGAAADCRVCLARFEPESVVNRLPCGHLFHRACLETWLDYDHATCPLCRLRLLPAADEPPSPTAPRFAAQI